MFVRRSSAVETTLIIYVICASAVMIWSTSLDNETYRSCRKHTVEYIAIPRMLLDTWATHCSNLVVFDVLDRHTNDRKRQRIPGSLQITLCELPALAKWLPDHTKLVLSNFDVSVHLDASIENTLLDVGIGVIYILDGGSAFPSSAVASSERIRST
jgi:hypothetical protein